MTTREKSKKALLAVGAFVAGILGLILLRWTPKTGTKFLGYIALFAWLVLIAVREGWSILKEPEDQ